MQRFAVWAALVLAQSSGLLVAASRGFAADKREGMIEPSCEELRAMWRYTKRQSRKADVTSDFPIYPDPVPYSLWNVPYPERTRPAYGGYRGHVGRQRNRAPPIYGRLVHKAPAGSRFRNEMPHRTKPFEDVAHLYGTVNHQPPSSRRRISSIRSGGGGSSSSSSSSAANFYQVPQAGRFQKLKELIRTERARELQEQHAIDQLVRSPPKQVTMATMGDEVQQPPAKHFSNSLGAYQLPGKLPGKLPGYEFDRPRDRIHERIQDRINDRINDRIHDRPRSMARVSDAERAWMRNTYYPREYRAR